MDTKRRGLIAGGMLAGAVLLATAGIAAAQDPTASPSASLTRSGAGMMTGQSGAGMIGSQVTGQTGAGMIGSQMTGQPGAGMMNGQPGAGMMTPELFKQMDAVHDQMVANGGPNQAQMIAMHAQHHPTR